MTIKEKTNDIRRNIMRKLTQNIGSSNSEPAHNLKGKPEIKRILICRPNHRLGNTLLITPLVQELTHTFPASTIDIFAKGGSAPIIFKNYVNIDQIIKLPKKPLENFSQYLKGWLAIRKKEYDLVINVDQGSSSGRLSVKFAKSKLKFYGDTIDSIEAERNDYNHFAKNSVYNLRYHLTKLGFESHENPIAPLNLKLSADEIEAGKNLITNLVQNDKKTICIFTYATGAKCYSETWWNPFYEKLKTAFPNCNIIEVLPVENVSQIGFNAPSFYSKDIREIASFIENTDVFIGADSGIMHLASSVQTPVIGLFSVTNTDKYKPYNLNSTAIKTNENSTEEILKALNKILTENQPKK